MFYLDTQTNQRYTVGTAFTYNNKQYPKTSATNAKFTALGFTQVTVPPKPDERFYVVEGPNDSGQYTTTERDLADLKDKFIKEVKLAAFNLLKGTDWYVIRALEVPAAFTVPADVITFRAQIRTVNETRCNQINACTTVAQLETLITAEVYIVDEPDGAMIQNPAALTAFPSAPSSATTYSTYY